MELNQKQPKLFICFKTDLHSDSATQQDWEYLGFICWFRNKPKEPKVELKEVNDLKMSITMSDPVGIWPILNGLEELYGLEDQDV